MLSTCGISLYLQNISGLSFIKLIRAAQDCLIQKLLYVSKSVSMLYYSMMLGNCFRLNTSMDYNGVIFGAKIILHDFSI